MKSNLVYFGIALFIVMMAINACGSKSDDATQEEITLSENYASDDNDDFDDYDDSDFEESE